MKEIIHNNDNLTNEDITETVIRAKALIVNTNTNNISSLTTSLSEVADNLTLESVTRANQDVNLQQQITALSMQARVIPFFTMCRRA